MRTGLDQIEQNETLHQKYTGKIGYLCHSASVNENLEHGLQVMKRVFKDQLVKVFAPQHGFVSDVQDNMVESNHFFHPHFQIQIYSLYSETRIPTDEMLEGLDHIFVDLQDVGTRIYTYIYTMTLLLEACAKKNIEVIILDRPNPINLETLEGNILKPEFASFVGRHPLPVRHGLSMGEVALMHQKYWTDKKAKLEIIKVEGLTRKMSFEDTNLPWVMPSPNLPTIEAAYTFVGTVLFEGTNISEGRGTTRSLEIIGHPKFDPWKYESHMESIFKEANLSGFKLRPLHFMPTFQKHKGMSTGGFQIHVTDRQKFQPWRVCQILCREFKYILGNDFKYKEDPYEYEYDKNPVDLINGDERLRSWYESRGDLKFLDEIEAEGMSEFKKKRESILIY